MLYKIDYKYFDKAKHVANNSDFDRTHVGCVAVYKGQIIGSACNCNKTHPTQKYYNKYRIESDSMLPKLHAEINCINEFKNVEINFAKVKLYIYRIKKNTVGGYGMARPCPSCMRAIKDLGIQHIYYTTDSGFAYECLKP